MSNYRYHDQTVTLAERTVGSIGYAIGRSIRLFATLFVVASLYLWLAPAGLKRACAELVALIVGLL